MTTKQEISAWFDRGTKGGATHLIVVCDTFEYSDYPVFAKSDEECLEKYKHFNGPNMQRVMEVYDLRKPKDEQLNQHRVRNLPACTNSATSGA